MFLKEQETTIHIKEDQSKTDTSNPADANTPGADETNIPEEILDPKIVKGLKRIKRLDVLLTEAVKVQFVYKYFRLNN